MDDRREEVIVVSGTDDVLGRMDKLQAHRQGVLHRAFSVFLFDREGRILLQRRALGKYHSGGLWSNTCCSHPRPGEGTIAAAQRRCREELGIACELEEQFSFIYRVAVGEGLIEHEYDYVLFGRSDDVPAPDPAEVLEIAWASPQEIDNALRASPERYTPWLHACWPNVLQHVGRP